MPKTPLTLVKEQFGSKDKLVTEVEKLATPELWQTRLNEAKGLGRISNGKLLRLHALLTAAKAHFGSRDKLIDAILSLEKRTKDAGYKTRLERYPLPRLLDLHKAAERRVKRAQAKAEPAKAKPKPKAAAKPAKAAAKKPSKAPAAAKKPAKRKAKKS